MPHNRGSLSESVCSSSLKVTMEFSTSQKQVLAIIPRVTGALSFLGSITILYSVLSDARRKLQRTYHRLCFAFSLFDCITSIWAGLSTWPIPEGTPGVYDPHGTTATCTAQGFFLQLSLISPLYISMLALYYLLLVKYDIAEVEISRKYELFMHAYPLSFCFGVAFAGLGLDLYNNSGPWCWISSYPPDCQGTNGSVGVVKCERGYNAWIFRWAFFYGPLWFTIVIVMVFMFMICQSVRQDEARSIQHRFSDPGDVEKQEAVDHAGIKFERSRKIFWQAFWYSGAFYVSWTAITVFRMTQLITGQSYFTLMVLSVIFFPMQGFWNSLVYNRGPCIA